MFYSGVDDFYALAGVHEKGAGKTIEGTDFEMDLVCCVTAGEREGV